MALPFPNLRFDPDPKSTGNPPLDSFDTLYPQRFHVPLTPAYHRLSVSWNPTAWTNSTPYHHSSCQQFWMRVFHHAVPNSHLIETLTKTCATFESMEDEYTSRPGQTSCSRWNDEYTTQMQSKMTGQSIPPEWIADNTDSFSSFSSAAGTTRYEAETRKIVRSVSTSGLFFSGWDGHRPNEEGESSNMRRHALLGTAEIKPRPPDRLPGHQSPTRYHLGTLAQLLKCMSIAWDVYGTRHGILTIGLGFRRFVLVDRMQGTAGVDLLVDLGPMDPITSQPTQEDEQVLMTLQDLFDLLEGDSNPADTFFYHFGPDLDSEQARGNPRTRLQEFFQDMGQRHLDRGRLQQEATPGAELHGRVARIERFDLDRLTDCLVKIYSRMRREDEVKARVLADLVAEFRNQEDREHWVDDHGHDSDHGFDGGSDLSHYQISFGSQDEHIDDEYQGLEITDDDDPNYTTAEEQPPADDLMRRRLQTRIDKRYARDSAFGLYQKLERDFKRARD
jgi:hypothetical protein